MRTKYNKKIRNRNTKKYHSDVFKKRKTIRGGEILSPPSRRMSVSPELLAGVPLPPPPRRMSVSLQQQQHPTQTSIRVSNLSDNKYKLCKEIMGKKKAIYGEGKVRRAIINNVNTIQSGNEIYLKNIEGNDYKVTLNHNDRDEIIEITTNNPLNYTQYPVTLVDSNEFCEPVQQYGGGENVVVEGEDILPFLPEIESENNLLDSDDEPPPLPLEAQLQGCIKKKEGLQKYFDYAMNEREHILAENIRLQDEITSIKYSDVAPVEYQVRSAGYVPHINAEYLYKQIDDVSLDKDNIDSRLELVATLKRKEPFLRKPTINFFYKFNISPPPSEKLFDAISPKGQKIQIPYPAVVFLRCQVGEENKLIIHGVYIVVGNTVLEKRSMPYEVDLKGFVKLETKRSYEKREKENKPVNVRGELKSFELKINGNETEMTFPEPDVTQIKKLYDAIENEKKSIGGKGNNYYLSRFNVDDVNEKKLYQLMKNISAVRDGSSSMDKRDTVIKTLGSGLTFATKSFAKSFVEGGKRKSVRYTMNKIKRNTKKNKK